MTVLQYVHFSIELWGAVFCLIAAAYYVFKVNNKSPDSAPESSYGRIEEANNAADFNLGGAEFPETTEQDVRGKTVTMKGRDGRVFLATWNYNNFAYTVSLNENGTGVPVEEMIEYVEATV